MHGRISPRRVYNSCGYTMKMISRYHRFLIYDVTRTTKIDGMGPFNYLSLYFFKHCFELNVILSFLRINFHKNIPVCHFYSANKHKGRIIDQV